MDPRWRRRRRRPRLAAYAGDKEAPSIRRWIRSTRTPSRISESRGRVLECPKNSARRFPTQAPANYQHTPLVVGGVMYMSSAVGAVVALDPTTGKTIGTTACHLVPTDKGRREAERRGASRAGPTARTRASSPTSAPISSLSMPRPASATPTSRERAGRPDQGIRAADHRLALEQRTDRGQGRRRRGRRSLTCHGHSQRACARQRRCRRTMCATCGRGDCCGPSRRAAKG